MQPISSHPVFCSGHSRSTFNNAGASRWKPLCRVHKWTLVYFIAPFSSIWKWNDALSSRLRLFVLSNRNNKRKIRTGSELGTFADVALVALFRAKRESGPDWRDVLCNMIEFTVLDRGEDVLQNGIPWLCCQSMTPVVAILRSVSNEINTMPLIYAVKRC